MKTNRVCHAPCATRAAAPANSERMPLARTDAHHHPAAGRPCCCSSGSSRSRGMVMSVEAPPTAAARAAGRSVVSDDNP